MSSSGIPASRRSTSTRSIASSALVSSSVVATLLAGTFAAAPVAQASSQVEQVRAPRVSAVRSTASTSPSVDGENDGPHSPVNRKRAATTTVRRAGVVVRDVDLGAVELGRRKGQFRAPVRGVLVTPDRPRANAPLVIMSHLRSPGCADDVSAFPCPGKDVRYDRGMTYLGE